MVSFVVVPLRSAPHVQLLGRFGFGNHNYGLSTRVALGTKNCCTGHQRWPGLLPMRVIVVVVIATSGGERTHGGGGAPVAGVSLTTRHTTHRPHHDDGGQNKKAPHPNRLEEHWKQTNEPMTGVDREGKRSVHTTLKRKTRYRSPVCVWIESCGIE